MDSRRRRAETPAARLRPRPWDTPAFRRRRADERDRRLKGELRGNVFHR